MRSRGLAVLGCLVAATLGGLPTATAAERPQPALRLQDPALLESSGLAVSRVHEDVLWTHPDGGSAAKIYAVDRSSGRTAALVTLAGVDPYDPEALAPGSIGGRPALFLADIGDNRRVRSDVSVFTFREPRSLRDQFVRATWYRFRYPDGPHDAEALLVHPRTGRIHIATKEISGAALYRAPRELVPAEQGTNLLQRVFDAPSIVTDGAFLPSGGYVLRTYTSVYRYDRSGELVARAGLPLQPQGESLAVDGDRLLVGSEGERSAVYDVPVPRAAGEAVGSAEPASVPASSAEDEWRALGRIARGVALAMGVVLVVTALVRSRRRRR